MTSLETKHPAEIRNSIIIKKLNYRNTNFPKETISFQIPRKTNLRLQFSHGFDKLMAHRLKKKFMNKNTITASFAERLRTSLMNGGYQSSRGISGVHVSKFASAIGYSPQICRKYLRGEAIPEPQKLYEIAEHLNVSPGWLLFGDSHATQDLQSNKITISKNLLHHLFKHISELCGPIPSPQYLPNFWLELTQDIQGLNTDEEQSKKIMDLALSSYKYFKAKD